MTGKGERLPPGWERAIPEALWPDVMTSAVRYDLFALRCDRVIETLRIWRSESNDSNPEIRELALKRIKKIARALVDPTEPEINEPTLAIIFDPTQAAALAHPGIPPTKDLMDTDSSVRQFTPSDAFSPTLEGSPHEEATVAAYQHPDGRHLAPRSVPPPPPGPPPPPPADTNDALPPIDLGAKRDRPVLKPAEPPRRASVPPPPSSPASPMARTTDEVEAIARMADLFLENKSPDSAYTQVSPAPDSGRWPRPRQSTGTAEPTQFDYQSIVSQEWKDADDRPTTASKPPAAIRSSASQKTPSRGSAPKGPSVSRSSQPKEPPKPKRPRASLVQVRTLYNAILPLCRELVPLNAERRARRFWAFWREASGDKGVNSEFVEQLLTQATSERTLVSELIAEVHGFDADSVRVLVGKIEEELGSDRTADGALRPRSAHSVRVEGIKDDDAHVKNDG